ncbi:four-helix bundle copper-binding protein [Roseisolibacter agri]|uniref:Ferredoxin n=1 Tax=Roseisolibacter agri TaxID=2014610 RepID=A0AA37QD61_9BACT|nr:four-helix bundle copper-binding protein [Roseisolibacter agri]GLC28157.1 ferredoxin [Roseisolibacter agri]
MAHTASHTTMSRDMEQCIQECLNCYSVCTVTAGHCLDLGGPHASRQHQTALLDCARACQTSADFMLRGSPMHARACALCAEACRACEQSCRSVGGSDPMMQQCAEACRRCAESCERMAAMAA